MPLEFWLGLFGLFVAVVCLSKMAIDRHYYFGRLLREFIEDQRSRARLLARAKQIRDKEAEKEAANNNP